VSEHHKAIVIHSPITHNAKGGKSDQLKQSLHYLRQNGIELMTVCSIETLDGLPAQGARWQQEGIDLVIAAGGDGLIGSVISHMINSNLPLSILPLGTANDIARTMHIPIDLAQAARVAASGPQTYIDIGIAQPAEQEPCAVRMEPDATRPASAQSYFAHALTVGINVKFAQLATDKQLRQQFGRMTYPVAVAEALRHYQAVDLQITLTGLAMRDTLKQTTPMLMTEPLTIEKKVAQVAVVNTPVFWGVLQATLPGVNLHDRLLDIVIIEDTPIENLITRVSRFFTHQEPDKPDQTDWHTQYPRLLAAELTSIPGIHHVQARSITIESGTQHIHVTLDGEVRGQTPITAQVAQRQLKLIVPRDSKEEQ
jgi:diacylglycerol kinase family enzyme